MKRIALFLAAMGAAAAAHASTITYEFGNPIVQLPTEIDQAGSLSLFDASLGTLTGATLTLHGAATTSLNITNNALQTENAAISQSVDLIWSSSLSGLNDASLLGGADLSMLFDLGSQNYTAGTTVNSGSMFATSDAVYDLGAVLAALEQSGGGSMNFDCQSVTGMSVGGGGGNISTSNDTSAGCGASITYTYTAAATDVSEPAPIGLAAAALMGLWYVGRRKA